MQPAGVCAARQQHENLHEKSDKYQHPAVLYRQKFSRFEILPFGPLGSQSVTSLDAWDIDDGSLRILGFCSDSALMDRRLP